MLEPHLARVHHKNAGFTLIEVMVAVAILAMAIPAMLYALGNQLDSTGHLRDKMFAQWVAENELAKMRIENRRTGRIKTSKQKGEAELAGQKWYWRSEAKEFPQDFLKSVYGIRLAVYSEQDDDEQEAVFSMSAVLSQYHFGHIGRQANP